MWCFCVTGHYTTVTKNGLEPNQFTWKAIYKIVLNEIGMIRNFFFFSKSLLFTENESEIAQSCPTLSDPMDCSLPGSSVHGIFQAIVLEWIAISFSRGSSRPRDQTQVSCIVDRQLNRLSHQGTVVRLTATDMHPLPILGPRYSVGTQLSFLNYFKVPKEKWTWTPVSLHIQK